MKMFRIVGVVALALALVSLGALGWFLRPGQYDGWVHTTGTVVAHERHVRISDGDRSVTYAIVVEYATESGQRVTTTSSFRSSDPMPVGAPVEVRYPPGKPYDPSFGNETVEFTTLFFGIFALVLGVLGTAFTIVGFRAGRVPGPGSRRLAA